MKLNSRSNLLKMVAGLVTVATTSVLIVSPTEAQQQGDVRNPSPSIFNEPPYNRTRPTQPTPEPSPALPSTPPAEEPTTGTSSDNVVALAAANGSFKTLTAALKAAGLTETLSGPGPFTVFAPTDEAFAAFAATLPPGGLEKLLASDDPQIKQILVKILTYHVVPGKVTSSDLQSGEVKTVEGGPITVKVGSPTDVMVNSAKVVQPDIQASNGVIHVINQVILPPDLQ